MPRAEDVVAAARSWVGTPFKHQGRLKGAGVDCAGLIICVAQEVGLTDWDYRAYARQPDSDEMERLLRAHMRRVRKDRPKQGDVLHLRITTRPQHLAFVARRSDDGLNLIHAYEGVGRVVEHIFDGAWRGRVVGAYRFEEL